MNVEHFFQNIHKNSYEYQKNNTYTYSEHISQHRKFNNYITANDAPIENNWILIMEAVSFAIDRISTSIVCEWTYLFSVQIVLKMKQRTLSCDVNESY